MTVGNNGVPGNATFNLAISSNIYNGGTRYPPDVAQNVPGAFYYTESLFEWQNNIINGPPVPNPPPFLGSPLVPNLGAPFGSIGYGGLDTRIQTAGVADAGTRIALRFNKMPKGAQLRVPATVNIFRQGCSGVRCTPIGVMVLTRTDESGGGPFSPHSLPSGFTDVPAGSMAVYEVLYADPFSLEYVDIPLRLTNGQSLPAAGVGVTVSFAPFTTNNVRRGEREDDDRDENARTPVPRFVATPAPAQ